MAIFFLNEKNVKNKKWNKEVIVISKNWKNIKKMSNYLKRNYLFC